MLVRTTKLEGVVTTASSSVVERWAEFHQIDQARIEYHKRPNNMWWGPLVWFDNFATIIQLLRRCC